MKCSPKIKNGEQTGVFGWYPYYAGFSPRFVYEALTEYGNTQELILDPWLGGGTTTSVASSLGAKAIGYDVNPALVTIARAKLAAGLPDEKINEYFELWLNHAKKSTTSGSVPVELDALTYWFDAKGVRAIRRYWNAIEMLASGDVCAASATPLYAESYIFDFLRMLMFRAVRSNLSFFETSNPTWIKVAKHKHQLLSLSSKDLVRSIRKQKKLLISSGRAVGSLEASTNPRVHISTGDSSSIRLPDASVSTILSSPPYCTRIDYVRATLPELATMSANGTQLIDDVSARMIGITTTSNALSSLPEKAPYQTTLDAIRTHESKASSGYYYRYFVSYFVNMDYALREIRRVMSPVGRALLVIQDSYYKNVHIDLVGILRDIGKQAGMSSAVLNSQRVKTSYSAMHPYRGRYRSSYSATESVVMFYPEN